MNRLIVCSLLLMALSFLSCDNKANKEVEPDTFVKIYDNGKFSEQYYPIDIVQTPDGGFLILASTSIDESPFPGIYVMKVDEEGEFVSEMLLEDSYVNAVKGIMEVDNRFYFFCMDRRTVQTVLAEISTSGEVSIVQILPDTYPLAASLDFEQQGFAVAVYNREDRSTDLLQVNTQGEVARRLRFDIGFGDFDAEKIIIDHMTGQGKTMPFFCGAISANRYYFNGFYNYTLSLVFFNFTGARELAVIQGYEADRPISALCWLEGTVFAVARDTYGDHYYIPKENLAIGSGDISSGADIAGNPIPEIAHDARISIMKINHEGAIYTLFGSTTHQRQIALYAYQSSNGVLSGTKRLGFSNPYTFAGFTTTKDMGLAVVGSTRVAGRFSRICFFKLGKDQLNDFLK